MLQWAVFYKMLEIPDDVEEPTAYQLLALDPREARSPARVDKALKRTKQRLRQRLPSPQFIPILAAFEVELDRAAQILSHETTRLSYDRSLQRQAAQTDKQQRASDKRRRIIAAARKAINAELNDDGTLDKNKRARLTEKLRKVGLGTKVIESLLKRIPAPVEREHAALELLAAQIPPTEDVSVATVEKPRRSARDVLYQVGVPLLSVVVFSGSVYFYATRKASLPTETAGAIEEVPAAVDPTAPAESDLASEIASPRESESTPPPILAAPAYDERADLRAARQLVAQLDAPDRAGSYARSLQSPRLEPRRRPLVLSGGPGGKSDTGTAEPDLVHGFTEQESLGPAAQQVVSQLHPPTAAIELLLADAVIAAVACAEQTSALTGSRPDLILRLDQLANEKVRMKLLAENTILVPMPVTLPLDAEDAEPLSPEEIEALTQALESPDSAEVYHAIAALGRRARAGAVGALEILFESSSQRAALATGTAEFQVLWRIVRELQRVDDRRVAHQMVKLMSRSRQKAFAHRLTYLLRDRIDPDLVAPSAGLLSLQSGSIQRNQAVEYWRERIKDDQFEWTPAPVEVDQDDSVWQPNWTAIRLLGSLDYHLRLVVNHLEGEQPASLADVAPDEVDPSENANLTQYQRDLLVKLKERARAARQRLERSAPPDKPLVTPSLVLSRLESTLNDLLWELYHLVSDSADGHRAAVDVVLFQRRARRMDAGTALQRIAVDLDVVSQMLELVALAAQDGQTTLETVRRDRREVGGRVHHVVEEMRDSMVHQLMLWELVTPLLQRETGY